MTATTRHPMTSGDPLAVAPKHLHQGPLRLARAQPTPADHRRRRRPCLIGGQSRARGVQSTCGLCPCQARPTHHPRELHPSLLLGHPRLMETSTKDGRDTRALGDLQRLLRVEGHLDLRIGGHCTRNPAPLGKAPTIDRRHDLLDTLPWVEPTDELLASREASRCPRVLGVGYSRSIASSTRTAWPSPS